MTKNIYQTLRDIKKTQTEGTTEIIYRFGAYCIWNNVGTKDTLLHRLTEEEHNLFQKTTFAENKYEYQPVCGDLTSIKITADPIEEKELIDKMKKLGCSNSPLVPAEDLFEQVPTQVKIKLTGNGRIPHRSSMEAAGFDIYATEDADIKIGHKCIMDLGFAIELPEGYAAFIYPRSGLGSRGLHLANVVGVIDSDYRGSVTAVLEFTPTESRFEPLANYPYGYCIKRGDRILQMVIQKLPTVEFIKVDELGPSDRGAGAYGSTGVK